MEREPGGVVASHVMDPKRRELYVEGESDQAFFLWILKDQDAIDARVVPIKFVDVPGVTEGGERGRLLKFLAEIEGSEKSHIRGFVDADQDRHLGILEELVNGWFTDHRDLEGYVLTIDNLDTGLRLGCSLQNPAAENVFNQMTKAAVTIAAIRLASARLQLKLPISSGKWISQLSSDKYGNLKMNLSSIIQSLMQEADVSLKRLDEVTRAVTEADEELQQVDVRHVIHGKDCMRILTKQLAEFGIKVDSASRIMWSTFRRDVIMQYPSLAAAVGFLRAA